jgi:hypothetical protein
MREDFVAVQPKFTDQLPIGGRTPERQVRVLRGDCEGIPGISHRVADSTRVLPLPPESRRHQLWTCESERASLVEESRAQHSS